MVLSSGSQSGGHEILIGEKKIKNFVQLHILGILVKISTKIEVSLTLN